MGTYEPFSAHRYRYIQRELSHVTLAQGGFEKFAETFTATKFLQTIPALAEIPRETVFGTGPIPIAWTPANDHIVITLDGAKFVTCKVKDSLGRFDLPRSVVKIVQGESPSGKLKLSVQRRRTEIRRGLKVKGVMPNAEVQPEGWLALVTTSTEIASY